MDVADEIFLDIFSSTCAIFVLIASVKPRSHEALGPYCDLCKTSNMVKSQVNFIRARDRS